MFAERIARISPDARILITIREQVRIIASVYMQYLSRGGTEPPALFFSGNPVEAFRGFDPAHFEYDRLVARYQALFGTENVIVLPHEMVASSQADAIDFLARTTGNTRIGPWQAQPPRAVSYPEASAPLLRRINHLRPTPLNRSPALNLGPVGDFAYKAAGGAFRRLGIRGNRVTRIARELFDGRFAASNQRLAGLLTHPVTLTGYQGIDGDHSA